MPHCTLQTTRCYRLWHITTVLSCKAMDHSLLSSNYCSVMQISQAMGHSSLSSYHSAQCLESSQHFTLFAMATVHWECNGAWLWFTLGGPDRLSIMPGIQQHYTTFQTHNLKPNLKPKADQSDQAIFHGLAPAPAPRTTRSWAISTGTSLSAVDSINRPPY